MPGKKKPPTDDDVGYRKPPREHQFQPGENGRERGKPKNARKAKKPRDAVVNVARILGEPVKVRIKGKAKEMQAFEAGLRTMAVRALKGNYADLMQLLKYAEEYDVIVEDANALPTHGVIRAPEGWQMTLEIWMKLRGLNCTPEERAECFDEEIWQPYVERKKQGHDW